MLYTQTVAPRTLELLKKLESEPSPAARHWPCIWDIVRVSIWIYFPCSPSMSGTLKPF